jgi:hypothetical protein
MSRMQDISIVAGKRTEIDDFGKSFNGIAISKHDKVAIRAPLADAGIAPEISSMR